MERRDFIHSCAATTSSVCFSLSALPAALAQAQPRDYARAKLVGSDGKPLKAAQLVAKRNYVFHYPFAATPCFLLDLDRATERAVALKGGNNAPYSWPGGVGAKRSVVAYSAICAHQLAYPTKEISFISFRAGKAGANKHADVIHCCAEHSQYDPAAGAKVLAGPAPQPLAAILLEHDTATDELTATGTLGGDMFNAFFKKYELKLTMEHGGRARNPVAATCVVTELDNFCRQQVRC